MLRKCGCAHIHTYWLKRKISSVLKASFCIWIPLQETVSVTIALPRELIYGPPVAVKVWDAALISRQLAGHATSRRCIPFARSTSRNAWLSITQRRSRIRGHIEILDSVLQSVIADLSWRSSTILRDPIVTVSSYYLRGARAKKDAKHLTWSY